MELSTEQQLIREAQSNIQAFASLYDHYFPKIYAYCLNRSGSKEIAEDVTSQTFLKSIEAVKTFDFEKSARLGPLLYAIAHNYLIDYFKKNNKNDSFDDYREETAPSEELQNAEKEVEVSEMQAHIIDVLNSINERYAQVISLKYYSELNANEIATALNIKSTHVPVLLFRALEAFRKEYEEKYPGSEIFYSI